jgi:4a-hydroxytetrahydrobiopterin dehydratase
MTTSQSTPDTRLLALASMHCREGAPGLGADERDAHVSRLPGWKYQDGRIEKAFLFANYHETIAFVNALAWIAYHEDHHPDLRVYYNRCVVVFSTHSAGGVTLNDVICAAKVERLFA